MRRATCARQLRGALPKSNLQRLSCTQNLRRATRIKHRAGGGLRREGCEEHKGVDSATTTSCAQHLAQSTRLKRLTCAETLRRATQEQLAYSNLRPASSCATLRSRLAKPQLHRDKSADSLARCVERSHFYVGLVIIAVEGPALGKTRGQHAFPIVL